MKESIFINGREIKLENGLIFTFELIDKEGFCGCYRDGIKGIFWDDVIYFDDGDRDSINVYDKNGIGSYVKISKVEKISLKVKNSNIIRDMINVFATPLEEDFNYGDKVQVRDSITGKWQNAYFVKKEEGCPYPYGVVSILEEDTFTGFTANIEYFTFIRRYKEI